MRPSALPSYRWAPCNSACCRIQEICSNVRPLKRLSYLAAQFCCRTPSQYGHGLDCNPIDVIERDLIAGAVVELSRPRPIVSGQTQHIGIDDGPYHFTPLGVTGSGLRRTLY
jgi:hypothetical protein